MFLLLPVAPVIHLDCFGVEFLRYGLWRRIPLSNIMKLDGLWPQKIDLKNTAAIFLSRIHAAAIFLKLSYTLQPFQHAERSGLHSWMRGEMT